MAACAARLAASVEKPEDALPSRAQLVGRLVARRTVSAKPVDLTILNTLRIGYTPEETHQPFSIGGPGSTHGFEHDRPSLAGRGRIAVEHLTNRG